MRHALILWQYLTAPHDHHRDGLLVVCGSYDLRVCDYACTLFRGGDFERLLITGKTGNWTDQLWSETEAHVFAERARGLGMSDSELILETEATNFGENIRNARRLAPKSGKSSGTSPGKVTFITKLNSIRRVLVTAPIQWPGADIRADGPAIAFPEEVSNVVGIFGLIEEMVGDVDRLIKYPAFGYQASVDIPDDVVNSYAYLIEAGFSAHCVDVGALRPALVTGREV